MRFLLYNLRYCTGVGTRFHLPFPWSGYLKRTTKHLDRVVDFIRDLNPDIAGLVEVDSGSFRSERLNQVEVLANALGHYHSYESKYHEYSFAQSMPVMNKQVNAFLSSDAIKNERFHYFDQGVKRLVIELELDNLTVFLVHLSLRFRHRREQLRDLSEMVNAVGKPKIVAGDFNAFWGERETRGFLEAANLRSANPERMPTYPSRRPRRELDFILCSPEIRITGFGIPSVRLSDHLPLVCDFDVAG